MTAALAAVPPYALLFALALAAVALPRRAGNAAAVVGALAAAAWLLAVPAGAHLPTTLFGFDAVLFHVDVYSRLLGATLGLIAAAGVAYGHAAGADRRQTAYALAYLGTGTGATLAGDWLTLVVFWELMALCATALVWHRAADRAPGLRYAIYHEIGGLALVAGVLLHYAEAGTFLFGGGIAAGLPAALVALGIGLNAGFFGLHVWLIDTYPRTHVATSVVLAAVTTKVGAYAVVRAFPDGQAAVAHVGGAMVLFGVTFAVLQTDVRRLLSYHVVSQVGYMVAGFGAGAALAKAGAVAHLVNNILYKSLLFMIAGVLIRRTGTENLKKLGGLADEMPVAAGVFLVAAASIVGLPGFNGFVSKGMVLDGVEKAGFEVLWYALVVGGVGTVVSFTKFGYYAFFHGSSAEPRDDLTTLETAILGGLGLLCLLVGVVPGPFLDLLPAAGAAGAKPFAGKQFVKTGAVFAAGLLTFLVSKGWLARITPVPDLDSVYHPLGRRLQTAAVRAAGRAEDGIGDAAGAAFRRARTAVAAPRVAVTTGSVGVGLLAVALVLTAALVVLLL